MLMIEGDELKSMVERCDLAYQEWVHQVRLHTQYIDKLSLIPRRKSDELAELVQSLKVDDSWRKHLDIMGQTILALRMAIKDAERQDSAKD